MGYVHLARHIAAPPADVFDRIVDVDRLSWLTLIDDIRAASPRLDQVGAQFGALAAWDGGTELEFDLEYELPGGFVTSLADRIWVERAIAHDLKQSLRFLAQIAG